VTSKYKAISNRKNPLLKRVSKKELKMVGTTGFEPATPCTPCKCATGLRYVPKPQIKGRKNTPKSSNPLTNPINFYLAPYSKIFGSKLALILYLIQSFYRKKSTPTVLFSLKSALPKPILSNHPAPCGRPPINAKFTKFSL
jgi:hypothetical protein